MINTTENKKNEWISENFFTSKKNLLKIEENKDYKCYPYIKPKDEFIGLDLFVYKLENLSLDFRKYFKYIPEEIEKVQFIHSVYSYVLEIVLFKYGHDSNQIIYEIFNHSSSGFTFTIFHLINQYNNIQPTFYFNCFQQYFMNYDINSKIEMIINEFIRICDKYELYSTVINDFFQKTNNNDEIYDFKNFYKLIEIIEQSFMIIENDENKKYQKLNIVVDDFILLDTKEYNSFRETLIIKEKKCYYLFKFATKRNNKREVLALDYFNERLNDYSSVNKFFYILSNDIFYMPRNHENTVKSCFNEYKQLEEIIKLFGFNYVDLFRFKKDIDLYLNNLISLEEMEYIIISKYRQEYSNYFHYEFLLKFLSQPLDEKTHTFKYSNSLLGSMNMILLLPYVGINLENNDIHVMGPIYRKIINKIIAEEKEYDNIFYKNIYNNNVQFGLSFEKYLKLVFQYKTFKLYKSKNIKKYFIYSKEIQNPLSINWNYINEKQKLYNDILFIIDQTNPNGKFFDILFLRLKTINGVTHCILFFIQISVKKKVNDLKEILDNFITIVNKYKIKIEKNNNYIFDDAFFYLISYDEDIYKKLFDFCFESNLYINITFDDKLKIFYYYKNSYEFDVDELSELPTIQNYKKLISNYLKYQIFTTIPKINITEEKMLNFSEKHDKIDTFGMSFETQFIKKKFGEQKKIKFLIKLEYRDSYRLKCDILGICEIKEKEADEKKEKQKYGEIKKLNKNETNSINQKLLGNKVNLIRYVKKQIYWVNDGLRDENGNPYNNKKTLYFHIFKITTLNKKKKNINNKK